MDEKTGRIVRGAALAAVFLNSASPLLRSRPMTPAADLPPPGLALAMIPFAAGAGVLISFAMVSFLVTAGQTLTKQLETEASSVREEQITSLQNQVRRQIAFFRFFAQAALVFGVGLSLTALRFGLPVLAFGGIFLGAGLGFCLGLQRATRRFADKLPI
ncbi:MAG: hypothetical protein H7Z41_07080 [Cytophagales bacterium]|nr:hypothetical protein [Armatimonadota bacterium]